MKTAQQCRASFSIKMLQIVPSYVENGMKGFSKTLVFILDFAKANMITCLLKSQRCPTEF